jgi:hypothetical protein
MFVFMGSYSGGDYDSSDDDDSQDDESTDDHTQTGVDDYTGDSEGDGSGEDSGGGKAAAAAGAAGAAGTAGAGGAGATGAAASGAGGGAVTEPPEGEDSGDGDDSDDEECEEEEEEENQPESPDVEESDIELEDDIEEPETEEDAEEEDADEEENEDEDEEEDETMVVVQEVDALSAMSWGVQPVMKHVEECYGEEIELFYKPAPVREIDPEQAKQKWVECSEELEMPIDPSFWDEDPPKSTELVNRAFEAALQQYRGMEYIRTLWRHGVAAGRDINDREILIELASDLGLDLEQFEKDLDEVEVEAGERGELPFTLMEVQGNPVPKNGRVRYSDFKTQFTFQGIDEQEPQELQGFVDEHGPVATPEVMEVYDIRRDEAVQRLQDLDDVSSFENSGENFWY